jgi:branched-subunit amino acid aminotransferase/4-amino-4-deoxychorismate lyase
MSDKEYICFNGSFIPKDQPFLIADNFDFNHGFVLSEHFFSSGSNVIFFDEHYVNLSKNSLLLKFDIPERIATNPINLNKEITKLVTKNRFFNGAKVSLYFFKNSKFSNTVNYLIESEKAEVSTFELNSKGLKIDTYIDLLKPVNKFSSVKIGTSFLPIYCNDYLLENNLDDCLILNENGSIIETLYSNLFYIKENQLFTPSLRDGCTNYTMRWILLLLADKLNLPYEEKISVNVNDLLGADEIILANDIKGILWVIAFRERRYYNKYAKILNLMLNELAFPDIS